MAFTAEEKESLNRLHQAQLQLIGALTQGIANITSTAGEVTHEAIGTAADYTIQAMDALNDGVARYLGVTATPAGAHNPDSRQACISAGAERLAFTVNRIETAVYLWDQAAALSQNPAYQSSISSIKYNLGSAKDLVNQFVFEHAYADVYPEPPTKGNGSHTIVGPHGHFDDAMWKIWRGCHYFIRCATDMAACTKLVSPDGLYYGRPYMNLGGTVSNCFYAMFCFSGVMPTTYPRFFFVLGALKPMTDDANPGTPQLVHFLGFELEPMVKQLGKSGFSAWDAALRDCLIIMLDAWKHSDGGAWQSMRFPDCAILNNPDGCKALEGG
jgi:hypothetical protein